MVNRLNYLIAQERAAEVARMAARARAFGTGAEPPRKPRGHRRLVMLVPLRELDRGRADPDRQAGKARRAERFGLERPW